MRMRKKPHRDERMDRCDAVWIRSPAEYRGRWRDLMPAASELRLEIGCGKGKFTVETAAAEPGVLFLGLEKNEDALLMAMESAERAGLENLFFLCGDAAEVVSWFAEGEIDGIYLNFPDPWPSNQKRRRRLTWRGYLERYRLILRTGGYLRFRTDNRNLFAFSKIELAADGWDISYATTDRHHDGPVGILTGYEERFLSQGLPICALDAVTPNVRGAAPIYELRVTPKGENTDVDQDPDRG